MSAPIGWGVFVLLVGMALAANLRELAEVLHAGLPWWRAWLEARERRRIGFEKS